MNKIGILGSTNKEILEILSKSNDFSISGIFDENYRLADEYIKNSGIRLIYDEEEFINNSGIFYLTGNIKAYRDIIYTGLKNSTHLFIEDIGKQSLEEVNEIIKIAEESNSVIQFRKKSYYTPALLSVENEINYPQYINITRNIKDTTPVEQIINEYLVYDIDMAFSFIKSPVRKIQA